MRSVDERIVDMQFNNKQFEDGIQTSLKSLDNLKKGLDDTGKGNSLSALQSGVETISSKFSALGIIGIAALQNITNSAIDAGKKIVSALAIDPVTQGFSEYELKMGSIQTIMAGTGESLETVNKYLDELNTYADKTIYSFADMTSNIGKFTNAGVSLEDAVAAIQGVSNVAAVSGANANEASRAMYNFAQALSAGYVKLIDWKSIENANMATVEFKTQLLETAVACGTLTKNLDGTYKTVTGKTLSATLDFNDSLKEQWMTTEVLVSTLGYYADETTEIGKKAYAAAQDIKTITQLYDTLKEAAGSGWAQTWEIVIGDFEEAKALLTQVGKILGGFIDRSADARNEMLRFWKDNGGREAIIQAITNAFHGLQKILTPVIEAFRQIFPPMTGEKLVAFSEGLRELTEKFKIGDETADKLKRTFAGLFAAVDMVISVFKFLFGVLGEVLGTLSPVGEGILSITATIGDFIVALHDGAGAGDIFSKGLEGVRTFLEWVADGVEAAVQKIDHWFQQFGGIDLGPLEIFSDRTKVAFKPFTFLLETAQKAFEGIKKVFDWVSPYFLTFAAKCGEAFSKIGEVFSRATGVTGFDGFLELVNKLLTGGILVKLGQMLGDLKEMTSGASGFLSNITGILDGVRSSLEAYQNKLKSQAILNIAMAIGVLAAALWVISTIPAEELQSGLTAITILFVELSAVMIVLSKTMGSVKLGGIALQMVAISTAVLILSAACKNLSGLSWEEMARGLLGIAGLLAALVGFEKLIGDGKGLMKIGFALIPLSTGLLIMSQAVKSLAGLSWEELAKGLTGIGVALLAFVGFEKLIGDGKGLIKVGFALIPLSTGMLILAQAIKSMSGLSWEELTKGLLGLGGALLSISLLSKIVKPGPMMAMGSAMIGLGAGMTAMAAAMSILGNMSWEGLMKGLIGITGVLTMVAAASKLISPATLLAMGAALVGVGAALNLMAAAMLIVGQMSWESIAKSLIAMAGALSILAVAMKLMQGSAAGAAALMAVSLALAVLIPSLVILGMMDLNNIGKMLLALAGVFGTFTIAAMLLAPITPVMLALAGAIALLGVSILALGVGLGLCAAAMTVFAVAGTAGTVAITAMVTSLISLIPMAIKKIGEGLVLLTGTLVEAVPGILTIVRMLLEGIINLVIEYTPQLMDMLGVLLTEVLALLLEHVPKIVDVALQMIVGILGAIEDNIGGIVTAAVSIVAALLKGITENIPKIIDAIFEMLEEIAKQIGLFIPRLVDLGFTIIISFLNGMADTIRENVPLLVDAAWNMVEAIIDGICYFLEESGPRLREAMVRVGKALWEGFKGFFGIHSPSTLAEDGAGQIIQGIINGLLGGVGKVVDTIKNVAGSIWNGFKNFFGIHSPSTLMETEGGQVTAGVKKGIEGGQSGLIDTAVKLGKGIFNGIKGAVDGIDSVASNVVNTLGNGLKNGLTAVGNAAKNIGNSIVGGIKGVLGIKSPARTMIEAAHYTGQGLVVGLKDMMSPVADAAGKVGDGAIDSMKDSLARVSDIMEADMDLAPTIRPVIDMSNVENGLAYTFSKVQPLNVGEIKGKVATVSASTRQNGSVSSGDTYTESTDNSQVQIVNYFHVRNNSDIKKINRGLDNILTKFNRSKGVIPS